MDWLYGISITCFAASYAVALIMEISRVFFQAPLRNLVISSVAVAGLFAHTVYLILQTDLELGISGLWFGSWSGWCLSGAWVLMAAYVWVFFRQPKTVLGILLLPVILGLIVVGWFAPSTTFTPVQAKSVWNMIHGASLLFGTTSVALGSVFGLAYLIHAYRLKKKSLGARTFRLPSLEWLQESTERALLVSLILLGLGLLSGVIINLIQSKIEGSGSPISWSDPVILSSGILFLWLFAAAAFNLFYKPARQGRKVAYVVIACFIFLAIEIWFVLWWGHGSESLTAYALVNKIATIHPFDQLGSIRWEVLE